ncbi:fimbria/pilus periplasmic chaperone [Mangrovibacter plantisponsor]|uniref:Fimbrial chaperone protein n=1 Tax=Mangrovibacter plantisponsor TaxID=451513 RepID=A0A317PWH9_9ENTR|nr:fimbria/pilus periplasmic chaperone [Mangrovibacter plantisponsor]PWW07087.1 fimbrial chaperone protein [Mangrovibacter plantisponsor]
MSYKGLFRVVIVIFYLFSLFVYKSAMATVVMTGSRIIYHSQDKSVDIQLRNRDNFPYVIQAWLDNGDTNSTPTTGKAPFMVTPPSFRIAANAGQVLRLSYIGSQSLPQDRESIFYFNFLQIPPSNLGDAQKNKLLLMIKNRMKVFYRPSAISANPKKISEMIEVTSAKDGITIKNNSPFYLSLLDVYFNDSRAKGKAPMIAPMSTADIPVSGNGSHTGKVKLTYLNDFGARVSNEYDINL